MGSNKRVLILRAIHQAKEMADRLSEAGFYPVVYPVIKIKPLPYPELVDKAVKELSAGLYDWLVFTSVNGVNILFSYMRRIGLTVPADVKIAAVGPATAKAIMFWGYRVTCIPSEFRTERLGYEISGVEGNRIMLARALNASPAMKEVLISRGARVDDIPVYETIISPPEKPIPQADWVVFTSPSTVEGFKIALGSNPFPSNMRVICIGPVTANKALSANFPVHGVATEYTIEGIIRMLKELSGAQD